MIVLTRSVSPTIDQCALTYHVREPIDLGLARAQHRSYEKLLAALGGEIVPLPSLPDCPDAVFVEDVAVVLDEVAVVPIPGAISRRAESTSMVDVLRSYRPLRFLAPPATLDGGDVLRVERKLFVGMTERTNRAGVQQLAELLQPFGYEVEPVTVTGCLHLKSACSYLGDRTLLANRRWFDPRPFREFEWIDVAASEPSAANVLLFQDHVVMPDTYPNTQGKLSKRNFTVRSIDVSELQKAEAGVTCCSVIFAP